MVTSASNLSATCQPVGSSLARPRASERVGFTAEEGSWNFLLYLLILGPHIRSADQRFAAKVVLWLDVWDLTALLERLKGCELQVSTRTPLLSLSNSPTRRPIHQAKSTLHGLQSAPIELIARSVRASSVAALLWNGPPA
jgi:hypothetical protein